MRPITGEHVNNYIAQCSEAIPVRITKRSKASIKQKNSKVNHANIIRISTIFQNVNMNAGRRVVLPSFCLFNARSLLPKIDELTALLSTNPVDLVAITESWLKSDIENSLICIPGFNSFRNDRVLGRGGGICVYVKDDIPCKRRVDLENPSFECLWLILQPKRLPRPLSGIVVCTVCHPPGRIVQDHIALNEYLINTTDLLGDFNDFDVCNLAINHNMKQVVKQPARGNAILDLIVTNIQKFYRCPSIEARLVLVTTIWYNGCLTWKLINRFPL